MRSVFLAALVVLVGCDTVIDEVDPGDGVEVASAEALAAHRAAWVAADVDRYRIRYEVLCFCPRVTVEVWVEDGRVVESSVEGAEVEPLDVLGLYDVALDAYAAGAASVAVRVVEAEAPLPVSVAIDYDVRIADEEIGYRVVAFEAE